MGRPDAACRLLAAPSKREAHGAVLGAKGVYSFAQAIHHAPELGPVVATDAQQLAQMAAHVGLVIQTLLHPHQSTQRCQTYPPAVAVAEQRQALQEALPGEREVATAARNDGG